MAAPSSYDVGCLPADEFDERACRRWRAAIAAPEQRDRESNGRVEASDFERRSLQGGERPREDGGSEASRGQRAQQERVAALEGEAQWLAGVGEPLLEHG